MKASDQWLSQNRNSFAADSQPDRRRTRAIMEYKGYVGKVEIDDEAGIFHGEVINTRDVITFQGKSVGELTKAFRDSVDDYLAFCKQRGEAPDKPFSGQFVTRISPELHRQVNVAAVLAGKSLNAFVAEQMQAAVQKMGAAQAIAKRAATRKKSNAAQATRGRRAGSPGR